ncbi:unnamed protein product [Bursaphelenchus xylophilus]|uniref:(pine wood nematode) hypothetical protein n=1 Tax=Bursaphelenchus xylophilus TaxID=6326 RepID=A0A7I8WNN7_BURXY|nr:unnamed protein product [Bursaphelenchus xylophilus]CAG9093898.1 unnamed protein product [Bursaphelenchus xylophilus]
MHSKTFKVSFLLYFSMYSGLIDAGFTDTLSNIWQGIKDAKNEFESAEDTAGTWVNDTEKEVNTDVKVIPLVPQLEKWGVLCSPCQSGVDFLSYYITYDFYVPLGLVAICPIIYAFDENAHNLLACEILVGGAIVFSFFGNSKKVCKGLGMCDVSTNSTKTKRSADEGMEFDDLLKLLPRNFKEFSNKMDHLKPADYLKVEHNVVEIIGQITKQNPQKIVELLQEIAPYYQ